MMSRRECLALAPLAGAAGASGHGAMMWNYFMHELDAADAIRRDRLKTLSTADQVKALGDRVRGMLLAAIGGLPQRTPLNAKVVGTLTRSDYVIEKIIFESRPQHYVTANLYRPKTISSRRPGVIESCGHYGEGKAAPDYQSACIGLAKKGIVAMIFDPMGQGERLMYRDARGKLAASGTAEHTIAGKACLPVGRTLAHFRIWDAIRALDYLESRPDVDKTRLGMLGHSGGGMMTLLTAPLDLRIRAAMSCCAVTSFYHKTKALLGGDPEQVVPGIYPAGVDHPELIAAVAPRAFLIGTALKDFVPLDGARRTYAEAKPVVELGGGHLAKVETNDEHKLNRELREACYGWMMEHLAGEKGDPREPAIEVESAETLRCTPTGCVMDIQGARSVFAINRDYAQELAARRGPVGSVFNIPVPARRDRGIDLPSRVSGKGETLLVLVAPRREPALAQGLAQSGYAVLELDLRGWGETTPNMPGKGGRFDWEDFFSYRAIELGRPLLAMRISDLLSALRDQTAYKKIYAVGVKGGGMAALHAAALSSTIAGVAAVETIVSYKDVMEHAVCPEPASSLVPGALLNYDLPQLVERIRPRPTLLTAEKMDARSILKALQLA
jgi:cephalosporin-C deacetylase-like acetyl esterase